MRKRRKLYPEGRRAFRLLIEADVYTGLQMIAKQRHMSMTAYIALILAKELMEQRKYGNV